MKYTNSLLLIILLVVFAACGSEERYEPRVQRPEKAHRLKYVKFRSDFNDMNDTHLAAAQAIGIRPLATRDEIGTASRELCFLDETLAYELENLTHSSPLLVPEAAALLKEIGESFQDSLVMHHYSPYKIIVTSELRTDEDVKKLSKRNINASKRSVHCYGTTFDITYKRFYRVDDDEPEVSQAKLKAVLGEVLLDLKKQGRCYVKHEIKQACFHITARN
ncbi:MAG: hypothetical protein J6B18_07490 [Bacteroidaceae bacterium]|nr:hypothetical protein [Bacteroidaceae bacterium]